MNENRPERQGSEKMRFDHPMKNHMARHLLNNWVYYEKNIDELRPQELENAKIFFSGIQQLTKEEQIFLAGQHRTPTGMRTSDKYMASSRRMPIEVYSQRRRECETALQNALMKYCEENKNIAEEVIAVSRYSRETLDSDRPLRKAVERYCEKNNIRPDKYEYLWAE